MESETGSNLKMSLHCLVNIVLHVTWAEMTSVRLTGCGPYKLKVLFSPILFSKHLTFLRPISSKVNFFLQRRWVTVPVSPVTATFIWRGECLNCSAARNHWHTFQDSFHVVSRLSAVDLKATSLVIWDSSCSLTEKAAHASTRKVICSMND